MHPNAGVIQGFFPQGSPRVVAQPQTVQRLAAPAHPHATQLPPHVGGLPAHGGQPLPPQVRQKMEAAFGMTFADVRIHITPQTQFFGATALTQGSNIHFAPGHYDPHSQHGQHLLGRELAHVVQQRTGRARNPFGSGVALVHDRMLEAEAERLARTAAHTTAPQAPSVQPKAAAPVPQRQTAIEVSGPLKIGKNAYRIAAQDTGRHVGSIVVRSRDHAIEFSNLGVEASYRQQGIGGMLMASAVQAGLRLGKSHVVLSSEDDGSGRLTQWYKSMGFSEVGRDARGLPRLQAPLAAVRPGVAQRLAAPHAPAVIQRASAAMVDTDDDLATVLTDLINDELKCSASHRKWQGSGVVLDMAHEALNCTEASKEAVNDEGETYGCHTCLTKLGKDKDQPWIGDHIPPTELNDNIVLELGFKNKQRVLYPHCDTCSEQQSALVRALNSRKQDVGSLSKQQLRLLTAGYGKTYILSSGWRVTTDEGLQIQKIGVKEGCHSCGGKMPKSRYHADHCPPKEFYTNYMLHVLVKLDIDIPDFVAKPQCPRCSNGQGGKMAQVTRLAKQYAKENGIICYS